MSEERSHRKKAGLARRLFRAVGQAGSTVGDMAGGLLRSATQTAKNAGGRASLSFQSEVEETDETTLRELAESFTQWLLSEHQGKADLQQQKPSTIELTELGQVTSFYEVCLEEPGIGGRRFRFVFRNTPLSDLTENLPEVADEFEEEVLFLMKWPQHLVAEAKDFAILVWDQACFVGERNPAVDLCQHWLVDRIGGTFGSKRVVPKKAKAPQRPIPIFGREDELDKATSLILTPRPRSANPKNIISLAAPGGTGKSYFLKALKTNISHRVVWAGVDHQGIQDEPSSVALLGRLLAGLAKSFEEQSVRMEKFSKELRSFRKRVDEDEEAPSGFFGHLKKAAETAAGINPIIGAASAGVVFLTSWGQQAKEESEALAKDNAIKALTDAFKEDLKEYSAAAKARALCWSPPVLVFDTYEWLAPLVDTWMRTEFLTGDFLHKSRAVLILSGREHLLRTDTRWSEWQHQIAKVTLNPFTRELSSTYLTSLDVPQERHQDIFELTEGLPLFLSLAGQIEEHDQAIGILAERVLEEVPPDYRGDFLKASALESFERGVLKRTFSEKSEEELEALIKLLGQATFTVAVDGKRAFIKPVRRILEKALVLEHGVSYLEAIRANSVS